MISLKNFILLSFILIVIVSVFSQGYFFYSISEQKITQEVQDHLTTAAQSRAAHLRTFLNDQKTAIASNATGVVFKDLLPLNKTDAAYAERFLKAKTRLTDTMKVSPYYYELFAIDSNGVVVVSSITDNEGLVLADRDYFLNGKKGLSFKDVFFSEVTGQYGVVISAPIKDSKGNLIGVYAARISLTELNKIVSQRSGLGESGEIFLLNSEGYMITPSKYIPDVILKQKVDTVQSRKCLSDLNKIMQGDESYITTSEDSVGVFTDYRGTQVLGTHAHVSPEANWCLMAKIDESEAIGVYRNELFNNEILLGIILILVFAITGFFISGIIVKPVKKLSEQISQITKGNLDVQLEKANSSEIQELTDSLNRVLASMKLAILRSNLSASDIGLGEAIEAKKEAEDKFSIIVNAARDAIVMTDNEDKVVFWNVSAEKMLGYTSEEMNGKVLHSIIPSQEEHKEKKDNLHKFEKTGKSFVLGKNFVLPVKRKDGKIIMIDLSISAVQLKGKWHAIGLMRDITDKVESEERYQTLCKSSFDAIMTLEPPLWKFTQGNPAALKLFLVKDYNDFISLSLNELSPKKQSDGQLSSVKIKKMVEKALKEGSAYFDWTCKTVKGKEFEANILFSKASLSGKDIILANIRAKEFFKN